MLAHCMGLKYYVSKFDGNRWNELADELANWGRDIAVCVAQGAVLAQ